MLVQTLNGLSLAGILVLVAVGLAMIFGLLGVINLAHGEFLMLGAYTAVYVNDTTHRLILAIILAPVAIGLLGLVIERTVIKRLYERPYETRLATWAISLIARQSVSLASKGRYVGLPAPVSGAVHFLGVGYPIYRLVLVGLGVAVAVGLW
ncbi:MAG: ABC transporter permease subunit, partial [Nitrososphaerales archaeon]